MEEKAIQFIGRFLSWYQDSYSLPEVVNRLKLEELVKEAESIHVDKIKELEKRFNNVLESYRKNVKSNLNDKQTKTLKRQVKRIIKQPRRSLRP